MWIETLSSLAKGGAGRYRLAPMLAWCVVFLAIFLIGVTKSGFGSGVGLMIVPMTAIAMDYIPSRGSAAALGLLLPLLVVGDLIAVYQYRRLFLGRRGAQGEREARESKEAPSPCPLPEYRERVSEAQAPAAPGPALCLSPGPLVSLSCPSGLRIIARLLPATAVGVVWGSGLLWWFHQQKELVNALMRLEIGFESILLVGIHWWRQYRGVQQNLMPEPLRSHLTGGFAAVCSTLAHAAGPIIAMYLLPLKLDRQLFVGASALYFFILNTAKLPAYYASGQFARAEIPFTLRFIPLVLAGAVFGFWINRRMNDKLFTRIVYILTFAMGWYILVDGARMLSRSW